MYWFHINGTIFVNTSEILNIPIFIIIHLKYHTKLDHLIGVSEKSCVLQLSLKKYKFKFFVKIIKEQNIQDFTLPS